LYWSAVINGLLAPFLLIGVWIAASDPTLMRGQPSSLASRILVAITIVLMFGAGIGLFLF
ncbi:MAG TPA: hypothetical protein VKC60_15780, partial [Opitutaceae bacterium]|nr:hypothetical protein [Opitutaceae bacterium]